MKFPVPKDPSEYMLIAANALPVLGVLFWGWDAFSVVAVFWLENVIVGAVNVLKMASIMVVQRDFQGIVLIPFFCFHYGMFTLVHGMFVFMLFGHGHAGLKGMLNQQDMEQIFAIPGLAYAFVALAAHHLFSFFFHFIRDGEAKTEKMNVVMFKPYGRIVMLHLTVILGGMATQLLHNPVWAVLMLTILKTIGDLALFQRAHEGAGQPGNGKV